MELNIIRAIAQEKCKISAHYLLTQMQLPRRINHMENRIATDRNTLKHGPRDNKLRLSLSASHWERRGNS
jgi:hypothetical protein